MSHLAALRLKFADWRLMTTRTARMILFAAVTCSGILPSAEAAVEEIPPLRTITTADSILIVSPHPDDESLCCGGVINAAARAGAKVAVVWVTNGDGFKWDAMVVERKLRPRSGAYLDLARRRHKEAETAAGILDVPAGSQFFLGYPDRGVLPLLFDYYQAGSAWRSRFTGSNKVVYEFAVNPGADYDGESLVEDFATVVDRVSPTLVFAPSAQDTHPDHRGAGILTWRVMTSRGEHDRVRYWIVHGGRGWPRPRGYNPQLTQTVAPRGLGMKWEQFALDQVALDAKLAAVKAHTSQTKVMGRVMESHVRSRELFSRTIAPPRSACTRPEPCEFQDGTIMEESGL